jgi:superfamily I DNA and/or RNA helicase
MRIDYNNMDSESALLWEHLLERPNKAFRQLVFDQYKSHCNVVGATCSSIGEKNTKNRPTKFFMNYCSIFGKVGSKTICKKGTDSDDEDSMITIPTFECKDGIKFTTVIQDESSKATPAELALPLIYGEKNIVIGDHRQLPPMLDKEEFLNTLEFLIDNAKSEHESSQIKKLKSYVIRNFQDMEISHFQRIFENIDDSLKGEFTLQYRMHPDINEVIKQFYEDDHGLECGLVTPIDLGVDDPDITNPFSRYHGIHIDDFINGESLCPNNHVVWIDVNSPEMIEGTSRVNEGEIEVISRILNAFSQSNSYMEYSNKWDEEEDKEIGIISFYSKQRNRIRRICKKFNNLPMKIDVVDRFQGMERNIIIVSMVRSNTIVSDSQEKPDFSEFKFGFPEQKELGFAQSPNRLNVALSRAKRLLIIIGNSNLFRQKDIYDNVYKIIDSNPNGKIIKCNPYEDIRK